MNNPDFCSFFKNNGMVVYNCLNIQTGLPSEPLTNCSDGELINYNEIYINVKTGNIYHKSFNLCDDRLEKVNVSGTPADNIRYLLWKKTRSGDWDWFISDVNANDLVLIDTLDSMSPKNIRENKELGEKLQVIKLKTEIMANTFVISKKYNMKNEDIIELTSIIKRSMDEYLTSLYKI
tara:strand:+ start:2232 stop:2765 length:534 start_codon:yes stop_codon:yes gene_type:complete